MSQQKYQIKKEIEREEKNDELKKINSTENNPEDVYLKYIQLLGVPGWLSW